MKYIHDPIISEDQAKRFLENLNKDHYLFHPEDDAADIIYFSTGEPVFTEIEARLINQRLEEVYTFLEDPCEYILNHIL